MPARRLRRGRHEPFIITIKAPGAKVMLTKEDIITIAQALTDAEGWRRRGIDEFCRRRGGRSRWQVRPARCRPDSRERLPDLAAVLADVLPEPPGAGGTS